MADKKPAKKKATSKAKQQRGDIKIVIGAKGTIPPEKGVELWQLEGEEVTAKGDRYMEARITTSALYELGWIKRKHK
tara:strand:- start:50 stop:280 length:231 start_codon:yes stop_codon:yes gene_type:complete